MNLSNFRYLPLALSALFLTALTSTGLAAEGGADKKEQRTLGVLVFPGFELLDAYGPLEMWGNVGKQIKVVTVAAEPGEIKSAQGPKTVAEYGLMLLASSRARTR